MLAMLTFVFVYSTVEKRDENKRQIELYESSTVTMEHVTENYLEGEQRICDVWAHYINSEDMTMQEAADFIHISHVMQTASAHIIYTDTLKGLSTRESIIRPGDYTVSYESMGMFKDISWIDDIGESINITRDFTNPINGERSIAFCNLIKLNDGGNKRDAVLLRILPEAELKQKWVFPQEEFEKAELSIIDTEGNYIIQSATFESVSTNFFNFIVPITILVPLKLKNYSKK